VTEIDFAYFNCEHDGLVDGRDYAYNSGRGDNYDGLVYQPADPDSDHLRVSVAAGV
jgi:hypothetical protein